MDEGEFYLRVFVEADIKKKHVAISFHVVGEAIAAGIILPHWLSGDSNVSDIMTKQVNGPQFCDLVDTVYWQPSTWN